MPPVRTAYIGTGMEQVTLSGDKNRSGDLTTGAELYIFPCVGLSNSFCWHYVQQ